MVDAISRNAVPLWNLVVLLLTSISFIVWSSIFCTLGSLNLSSTNLAIHGNFLYLAHKWFQKTTWMYISVPLLLYMAERCRSEHYSVKIIKVSVLPGNVFNLIMSKPPGFKYKSGNYIFLKCPTIYPFEWHPFPLPRHQEMTT